MLVFFLICWLGGVGSVGIYVGWCWLCWIFCWVVLVLLEFMLGGVGSVGIYVGGCWFCWKLCWSVGFVTSSVYK